MTAASIPIFRPFSVRERGVVYNILCRSYHALEEEEPQLVKVWKNSWQRFDSEIYNAPETVGSAGFFTMVEDHCIGLASYDPRNLPEMGIMGHNCILPKFRGKGYGKAQVLEIIRIFREKGCMSIEATTGNHPFFGPAYEMYRSCGFSEKRRESKDTIPFELIILELSCEEP